MKERPILFSAMMVRAILEGRKTQTRRAVKPQPPFGCEYVINGAHSHALCRSVEDHNLWVPPTAKSVDHRLACPYGRPGDDSWQFGQLPGDGYYYVKGLLDQSIGGDDRPVYVQAKHFTWGFDEKDDPEFLGGDTELTPNNIQWKRAADRLWVRETWGVGSRPHPLQGWRDGIEYRADQAYCDEVESVPLHSAPSEIDLSKYFEKSGWRPSIHMPRWASRIDLEITSVRVERLQSISDHDLFAEGMTGSASDARLSFAGLWEAINGFNSWRSNPWVWVVEFRRIKPEVSP